MPTPLPVALYDATNPQARKYLWLRSSRTTTTSKPSLLAGRVRTRVEPRPPGNLSYSHGERPRGEQHLSSRERQEFFEDAGRRNP